MIARSLSFLFLLTFPAAAQDFSQGSEAKSWNLYAEVPARFEAKVVDLTCEITGDCPANCGEGRRQLGLLRSADNVLVYPNKNNQPVFTGAALELLPFCGKQVEVDGLMIVDPDANVNNIYQLQLVREVGSTEWTKANRWTKEWAKANPDLPESKDPWFRRDPRITAALAEDGWFGLGLETDAAILKELFP